MSVALNSKCMAACAAVAFLLNVPDELCGTEVKILVLRKNIVFVRVRHSCL